MNVIRSGFLLPIYGESFVNVTLIMSMDMG